MKHRYNIIMDPVLHQAGQDHCKTIAKPGKPEKSISFSAWLEELIKKELKK